MSENSNLKELPSVKLYYFLNKKEWNQKDIIAEISNRCETIWREYPIGRYRYKSWEDVPSDELTRVVKIPSSNPTLKNIAKYHLSKRGIKVTVAYKKFYKSKEVSKSETRKLLEELKNLPEYKVMTEKK